MENTKKQNLTYDTKTPDFEIVDEVDSLIAKPEMQWLTEVTKDNPEFRHIMAAWPIQSVYSALDPLIYNEVTKGGHAMGKSLSGGIDKDAVDTPKIAKYIRPNGEEYIPRAWGAFLDVEVLQKARATSDYPLLYGPPGTGKTAMADAAFLNDHLVTVIGTGDTEVADFVGGYIQNADGQFEWVDGPLIIAAENGYPLLIDEIGLIDPKVLSLVYGLMDGRRELIVTANPERGIITAKDGFFVIAATNPDAPGVRISEALLSRFALHVEVGTDYNLARKMGVDNDIVTAASHMDKNVRKGAMTWAPQMRELLAFQKIANSFGRDFAVQNMIAAAPKNERQALIGVLVKGEGGKRYTPASIR